jgi:hypothetical protein
MGLACSYCCRGRNSRHLNRHTARTCSEIGRTKLAQTVATPAIDFPAEHGTGVVVSGRKLSADGRKCLGSCTCASLSTNLLGHDAE